MDLDGSKLSILILDENARFYTKWRLHTFRALDLKWFEKVRSISFQKPICDSDFDSLNTIAQIVCNNFGLNDQPKIKTLNELQLPVLGMQKIAIKRYIDLAEQLGIPFFSFVSSITKGPSLYYVNIFSAFLDPTHPPCQP